jgi:hypothetical protein
MDNNPRPQFTYAISNKKKKFYDLDLDLKFQISEKNERELTQCDLQENSEEDQIETVNEEGITVNTALSKGINKQRVTTQQVKYKLINPSVYEIFDSIAINPYKAQLKLNYSFIKNIKEIKLSNPSMKMQCDYCRTLEFDPEWVDYKEGKFYSMICPECVRYIMAYYEVQLNEQLFQLNNSHIKVISADVEVKCNCGQIFIKEKFCSGNIYKRCDSCGEHINLLDCNVVTTQKVTSDNFTDFTKDDVLKLLSMHGFCITDPIKYGFKMKIENYDQTEKVDIGRNRWVYKCIDITVTRKKLTIEKVNNKGYIK